MEHKEELKEMKETYQKLSYKLPSFEELEENFDLDKISDRNQKFILLNIRRVMVEKFSNYSQLFEALLNPVSQSRLLLRILKKLDNEKKDKLREYCDKLLNYQYEAIKMELVWDEKKEANFVNQKFKEWNKMKDEILELMDSLEFEMKDEKNSSENNYFS